MVEIPNKVSSWVEESGETTQNIANGGSQANEPPKDFNLQLGDKVGRFILLSKLGEGGMGLVYAAYDPDLNRKVALKFVRPDSDQQGSSIQKSEVARSRLIQEAQSMARISHPNVVAIYDVGLIETHVFLAMELIEGKTLKSWIQAGGYTYQHACEKLLAAGQGLVCAHAAGFVHRDFKPDNVLLSYDGRVCVGDFGLVYREQQVDRKSDRYSKSVEVKSKRRIGGSKEHNGPSVCQTQLGVAVMRTPSYMSPEQHRGEFATAQSDQYSFCVCFFEAIYGVLPYQGRNREEILESIQCGRMTVPSRANNVPRRIQHIIVRGLSINPQHRYPSMHELLAELNSERQFRVIRGFRVSVAAALFVAALNFGGDRTDEEKRQRCHEFSRGVDLVWTEERRALAKTNFRNSSLNSAAQIWMNVDQSLQRRRTEWSQFANEICEEAHRHGHKTTGEIELQMECLQGQLVELQTFGDLLEQAEGVVIKKAESILNDLPTTERCQNITALQQHDRLPSDLGLRRVVQEIHDDLRRADIMRKAGQRQLSVDLVQGALYRAQETGYASILAQVYLMMAWQSEDVYDFKLAQEQNQRALVYAEAGGDDRLIVTVAAQGIFINSHVLKKSEEVDDWIRHTRAHLERAGNPPLLQAKWLLTTGVAYGIRRRLPESEIMFREALEIFSRELGEEHRKAVKARSNLAISLELMGKLHESETHLRKSIELTEARVGVKHPSLALPMGNLSKTLAKLGEFREALLVINRSINISESNYGQNSRQAIREYDLKANIFFLMGRNRDALIERSRVLEILKKNRVSDSMRRRSLFHLADIFIELGEIEEASEVVDQIRMDSTSMGQHRELSAMEKMRLIYLLGALDRKGDAQRYYENSERAEFDNSAFDIEERVQRLYLRGELERGRNQGALAETLFLSAYDEAKRVFPGENNMNRIPFQRALARIAVELHDWSFARRQMDRVVDILQKQDPALPNLLAGALLQLAKIHIGAEQWENAHAALNDAQKFKVPEDMDPRKVEEIDRLLERSIQLCGPSCAPK